MWITHSKPSSQLGARSNVARAPGRFPAAQRPGHSCSARPGTPNRLHNRRPARPIARSPGRPLIHSAKGSAGSFSKQPQDPQLCSGQETERVFQRGCLLSFQASCLGRVRVSQFFRTLYLLSEMWDAPQNCWFFRTLCLLSEMWDAPQNGWFNYFCSPTGPIRYVSVDTQVRKHEGPRNPARTRAGAILCKTVRKA